MSPESSSAAGSARSQIDVRTLSLAQLHRLAAQGSRRARAELENRLNASGDEADSAPAPIRPAPVRAVAPAAAVPALPAQRNLTPPPLPAAPPVNAEHLQRVDQLELMARQDEQRSRIEGPPRLVGLVLIAWGALLLLGALVMLGTAPSLNGAFYAYCALGSAAIGWLLMRCSRWALVLHGVLLVLALGWAWYAAGSPGLALMQAIPLLIPAAWMVVPLIREPLE